MIESLLITGANRGLGLGHVARFAKSGSKVFAGVRDPKNATELQQIAENPKAVSVSLPMTPKMPHRQKPRGKPQAIRPSIFSSPMLASMAATSRISARSMRMNFARTLNVNTIAPLLLADALKNNVAKSKRKIIAFQSSQMGSNAGTSPGNYAYRSSKAALNKIASTMANELKGNGIIVVTLHPGWVQTDMGGKSAPVTIPQSVEGQLKLFERLTLEMTGGFYNYDGARIAW